MRVLVNALPLRYGGGVTYLMEQMAAFARVVPDWDLHHLVAPWAEIDGLPGTTEVVPGRNVAALFAYEQLLLPLRPTDVLYCPANFGPFVSKAPMVLTVHNAHYYRSGLEMPETSALRPPWKVKANHWAMRCAHTIVAISHAQAHQVEVTLPGIAHKLRVIHSGVPGWPATSNPVRSLPDRYVLTVANTAAHKRVGDVVAGWAGALDLTGAPVALVLVGRVTSDQITRYRAAAGRHERRLVFNGPVSDRGQLKWMYENATVMVSMSALESFPLTPSEAGSVGCPIVLSDIPTHREVSLGHATFVQVGDTTDLALTLADGFTSWEWGRERWEWPVTWDDNARALFDILEAAAG